MSREFKGKSLIAFPDSYVLIDIETTGLDFSCDIIEVAALKISDGEIVDSFSSLIQPNPSYILNDDDTEQEIFVDEFITELTGITNDMLKTAPKIDQVLPALAAFIGSSVLVGHNIASFDSNFLYDKFLKILNQNFSNDYIDTLRISRWILDKLKHFRLSDIASYYSISYEGAHRALSDCHIAYKCFEQLKTSCIEKYGGVEPFLQEVQRRKSLKARGLRAEDIHAQTEEFDISHPLYGKVCVFTGTLEKMTRREAMQIVKNLGGENGDSVTKKTNYLILGNNDFCKSIKDGKSSKQKKAEKLKLDGADIDIISEDMFYAIIEAD